MSVTSQQAWVKAIADASPDALVACLAEDVTLAYADVVASRGDPVAYMLADLLGPASGGRIVELGDQTVLAVRREPGVSRGSSSCLIIRTEFNDAGLATAIAVNDVPDPQHHIGIEPDNHAPEMLLGARPRELANGIAVQPFSAAKHVTKHWGNETWLHMESLPFGFKVIRIQAGCRTSLQYHETKTEVYFVLDGLARLHFRAADGSIATAPFIHGTIATVQPLAWHRVEAITDVILIEASTFDDGSDNIRVEDDYGRASGRIGAEHET